MLNSKHYIKDAEVCNFVNIPVDNVHVYPSEETELKMMNKELK
jgi:hypothetical protein